MTVNKKRSTLAPGQRFNGMQRACASNQNTQNIARNALCPPKLHSTNAIFHQHKTKPPTQCWT